MDKNEIRDKCKLLIKLYHPDKFPELKDKGYNLNEIIREIINIRNTKDIIKLEKFFEKIELKNFLNNGELESVDEKYIKIKKENNKLKKENNKIKKEVKILNSDKKRLEEKLEYKDKNIKTLEEKNKNLQIYIEALEIATKKGIKEDKQKDRDTEIISETNYMEELLVIKQHFEELKYENQELKEKNKKLLKHFEYHPNIEKR